MTLTESSRKGSALAQFRQIYRWQLKRSRLISILCLGLTLLCFTVVHCARAPGITMTTSTAPTIGGRTSPRNTWPNSSATRWPTT